MRLNDYLTFTDRHLAHFEDVRRRYRELYACPDTCRPMLIINAPASDVAPVPMEAQIADPFVMLKAVLDAMRPSLEIGDDRLPMVTINFGAALVGAAFGCELYLPPNNAPAASTHVLAHAGDIHALRKPALDAGWFGKLDEWIGIWREHLPPGIPIRHGDVQSPLSNALLVRGDDLLTDFYDHPDEVEALLHLVTDYMVDVARHNKTMIGENHDWFMDAGALWKGAIRMHSSAMHLISPDFYRNFILKHDRAFLAAMGGGRLCHSGTVSRVIDDFFTVPGLTGLDVEFWRNDFHALSHKTPRDVVLNSSDTIWPTSDFMQRLLRGDWPEKRNIILQMSAPSAEEGKRLLDKLRQAMPY